MTMPGKGDHNAREAFIADTLVSCSHKGLAQETHINELGHGLRILSATERERLQGFPVGWTDGHSFTARCRMLGNAMTVPVVEHFGRAIVAAERAA
jgi:site-specific DNA-cytosine methylase